MMTELRLSDEDLETLRLAALFAHVNAARLDLFLRALPHPPNDPREVAKRLIHLLAVMPVPKHWER